MSGAGRSAGPTPWWQLPGQGNARSNLTNSAPEGYRYDPIQMGYQRTPQSLGSDAGSQFQGLMDNPALKGLLGDGGDDGYGGATTNTTTAGPGGGTGTGTGGTIPSIAAPDSTAATNAAFAGAKDRAGAMSRASLTSLNDELGASGMIGSGAQVQGTRDIISEGAGNVGQVSRDLASKSADQAADFAKTSYQGQITQRGQDIQREEARARLAQERRMQQQQMLLTLLRGLGGGSGGGQMPVTQPGG